MITVENTNDAIRLTIPKGSLSAERLSAFIDWLRFEEIAQRSRLTEEEADRMAEESKSRWWAENGLRFIPAEQL